MQVAVIKYNAGNIRSVVFALQRLGVEPVVTDVRDVVLSADRVIFPGVGEAAGTMAWLRERGMDRWLPEITRPFLGICLGMQLMCSHSEEGDVSCLGIFPHRVRKFETGSGIKVPHMGWNRLEQVESRLIDPSLEGEYVYFVHSYYVEAGEYTSAVSAYGLPFSAAIEKDNFFATQFHPEKSGEAGSRILQKFLSL